MKLSALALALKRLNISRVSYAATEWNALNRKATSWFQQGNYTKAAMAATKAVQAAEEAVGLNHQVRSPRTRMLSTSISARDPGSSFRPCLPPLRYRDLLSSLNALSINAYGIGH